MTIREDIRKAGREGPWHVRTPGAGWRQDDADVFTIGDDANGTRPPAHRLAVRYSYVEGKGWDGRVTDASLDGMKIAAHGKGATVLALLRREPLTVFPYGAYRADTDPRAGQGFTGRCPHCGRELYAPWCAYCRWDNGVDPAPWASRGGRP